MSRIGRLPIKLPKEAKVTIDGRKVMVQGPKGKLERTIHPKMKLEQDGDVLKVVRSDDSKPTRALHGLTRALVANMVTGVTKGFVRELIVTGVGYKVEVKGKVLVLNLGYSHPIEFNLPEGITAKVDSQKETKIVLEGYDKELLGLTAARIRSFRPPEPYKGKGIRYADEVIIRKAGKAAAK
ncbi:MAG: 50S ribosomal protein L6 [Thermodesulfobacteria bacterium]|nr:50S ribosomal protein L6 [Thermodesulfobacteriota bacterium]